MRRNIILALAASAAFAAARVIAQEHADAEKHSTTEATVTGEVLDMVCYIDHGGSGEKHASCAKKCITANLPVGIKGNDGKTYLLVGEHKSVNDQLAQHAGKTITVKGKVASRDGFNMIENAVIQK